MSDEPITRDYRVWVCTGHRPTTWAYGCQSPYGSYLVDTIAVVARQPDGSWAWRRWGAFEHPLPYEQFGTEPSRRYAMLAATREKL